MARTRVLVVDDDRLVRRVLARSLTAHGFDVSVAESAIEALAKLQRDPVDLVISDVNMPGEDGFWLIDRMRERDVPAPVILMSGATGHTRSALAHGAIAHFEKPFVFADLAAAIELAVAGAGDRSSARRSDRARPAQTA